MNVDADLFKLYGNRIHVDPALQTVCLCGMKKMRQFLPARCPLGAAKVARPRLDFYKTERPAKMRHIAPADNINLALPSKKIPLNDLVSLPNQKKRGLILAPMTEYLFPCLCHVGILELVCFLLFVFVTYALNSTIPLWYFPASNSSCMARPRSFPHCFIFPKSIN